MIVRHRTLLTIAVLVLLASDQLSFTESVKLRKPRKRTTTRAPYQQSRIGPVIIKVMHKYTDDGLAHGTSVGCTKTNCRNVHDKFHLDVNKAISKEDNFLSDEESLRYVVHPEKYEHFVLRKNTGHPNRYKRNSGFSELHTTIDRGEASTVVTNKGNFTRVPLYKINYSGNRQRISPLSNEANRRTRRSFTVDYSSRRNDSDYYTQRKAVMERYYARQREINARYANRTNVIPRLEYNVSQHHPATSNATLFNLGRVYSSKDSTTDRTTFRHSFTKIDSNDESQYKTGLNGQRNIATEIDLGFKSSDADLSQTRSSSNIERNALDYFVTPTPCTNFSSPGTFAPKTRPKPAKNCTNCETEQSNETHPSTETPNDNTKGNLQWGKCEGKIVYQHNLLLGLTGLPSNLDALFEVIIQGPICITCVEALRYNETRATVSLDSGGRGHEYAKLRLQGYENEGFSYIIKVWGINKTGEVCVD